MKRERDADRERRELERARKARAQSAAPEEAVGGAFATDEPDDQTGDGHPAHGQVVVGDAEKKRHVVERVRDHQQGDREEGDRSPTQPKTRHANSQHAEQAGAEMQKLCALDARHGERDEVEHLEAHGSVGMGIGGQVRQPTSLQPPLRRHQMIAVVVAADRHDGRANQKQGAEQRQQRPPERHLGRGMPGAPPHDHHKPPDDVNAVRQEEYSQNGDAGANRNDRQPAERTQTERQILDGAAADGRADESLLPRRERAERHVHQACQPESEGDEQPEKKDGEKRRVKDRRGG